MSGKYKLDRVDWAKIGIGAVVAVTGALLTYIGQVVGDINWGIYTPIVVSAFSVLANVVRKWMKNNKNEYNE